MQYSSILFAITFLTTLLVIPANADKENFKIFLCFGQSNIAGGSGVNAQGDDKEPTDRVMALAFNDCGNPSWQKDTWVPAREPLHCGDGGSGNSTLGPVYAFGRAMADSLPNDTIGLIPCGQSGVNIEYFMKNGSWNSGYRVPYPGGTNVWQWMVDKCKLAVERGVFAGIMLHQGESNSGQGDWPDKVKEIYEGLLEELEITDDIPLVAGELLPGSGHNAIIGEIPNTLPFGYVASSQGLSAHDQYHFNRDSYLKLGERFAVEMMKGLHEANLITKATPRKRVIKAKSAASITENVTIYSLDGRMISNKSIQNSGMLKTALRPGNMYIIKDQNGNNATKLMMVQDK